MAETAPPRHERNEIDWRRITLIGVGILAVLGLGAQLGSYALFHYFSGGAGGPDAAPPSEAGELPPAPRLQSDPPFDLERLRAEEKARLETYGWVNRERGIARIPVERAMDLVIERGLPAEGKRR
jgi:hypothetical protein